MRDSKFFTVATAVIALLVVLGMLVMSSGVLSLIFDPEPEIDSYYLLKAVVP
ncbi:hypothetical protein [Glutamicibacter sp. NPDC087344]|uniref:hypothetical protein n=1 Tax=Glutamicibacter sp. NPDC087344 TaxID=3363994 RepID=UPI00380049AB